jgi:predicted DCC family thiol-disulfide oxidoreductase YuxK
MSAGVVVYDGDCGICEASAGFIRKHIPNVDVMSHHDYGVSYLSSVWFVTNLRRYEGSTAVAAILKLSDKRILRTVGSLIALPGVRVVASAIYFVVAKNRRRISQLFRLKACAVPQKNN